ncbi:hypothetical protein [Microcystis phage Mel-JY01]
MNTVTDTQNSTIENCKYFHWNPEAESAAENTPLEDAAGNTANPPSVWVYHFLSKTPKSAFGVRSLLIELNQLSAQRLKEMIIEQINNKFIDSGFPDQNLFRVGIAYLSIDAETIHIHGFAKTKQPTTFNSHNAYHVRTYQFQICIIYNMVDTKSILDRKNIYTVFTSQR